jgi:hypothetical protein
MISGELGELLTIEMPPVALPAVVGANFAVNEAVWPAAIVAGTASPLMVNPEPDTFACEIEMLPDPEFVNVTDDEPFAPTFTLPKATFNGLGVKLPCTPDPVNGIERLEFAALLVIVTLPETLPDVVGANCPVKLTVCPAATVAGAAIPETLKAAPLVVIAETVALAFPEFVSEIVCWPVLPTATLPNETLAGLAARVALEATPVPERVSVWGEFGALKLMLPVTAPAAVGANCVEKEIDWPAERVMGRESPEMPNAFPETFAMLMTTFELPVLVSLTLCEGFWPTATLPKLIEAGETTRPACAPDPVSEIARGELDASLITVIAPLTAPEAVGANWICMVALCPTWTAPEGVPLTIVNAAPVMLAWEMLTAEVPEFVIVRDSVAVFPIATSPKPRVVVLAERMPAPGVTGVPVPPFAALV